MEANKTDIHQDDCRMWLLMKKILRLGAPIMVGQIGMIVTGFADTMMVGYYSTEALASASFVNNVFIVAICACLGFTYGITPLVGILFTQKRHRNIGTLVKCATYSNLSFALLVTLVMGVIYLYLDHLGQPTELLPLIRPYYLIYLFGIVAISLFNVFAQWSYAINNTLMPMWIILGANVLNIFGNWLLIFGNCGFPELGLTGAGLSTFVARWIGPIIIMLIFFMKRSYSEYREGFKSEKKSQEMFRSIRKTSWPVALQMTFESGCFAFAAVMVGWLGAIELAAYQIFLIVGTLGFMLYCSMASATSVLVSNAAGMSNTRLMRRTAGAGYLVIVLFVVGVSVVFVAGGSTLLHLFTRDTVVLATATTLIFPLVLYQLGDATQIAFANALRGTSNVVPMLWIAFVSYIIVGIPSMYLFGFTLSMGIYGIAMSFSVPLFLAAVLYLWQFMHVTRLKNAEK